MCDFAQCDLVGPDKGRLARRRQAMRGRDERLRKPDRFSGSASMMLVYPQCADTRDLLTVHSTEPRTGV